MRGVAQPAEGVRVEHGRADPADHVAAERLLLVEHRADRRRASRWRGRAASRRPSSCRGRRRSRSAARWCRRRSTSTRTSSTITAVTVKSLSRRAFGRLRRACRSTRSSRSSICASSRSRSGAWSASVGSVSVTHRFWTAGRRMTCRPTPTVAALGRVSSGGTSTRRSRLAGPGRPAASPAAAARWRTPAGRAGPPGRRPRRRGPCTCGTCRGRRRWSRSRSRSTPRRRRRVTPGGTRTSRSAARFFCSSSLGTNAIRTRPTPSGAAGAGGVGCSPSRPSRR